MGFSSSNPGDAELQGLGFDIGMRELQRKKRAQTRTICSLDTFGLDHDAGQRQSGI
jgi:hypothetical protein